MKKTDFKNLVKTIICEVKKAKKESDVSNENSGDDYLNQEKSKFRANVENDPKETATSLLKSVTSLVKKIDKDNCAELDDHGDIKASQPGVFYIRISPKWAGMYDVEAYKNMSDRIYAIGLNKNQVMDFIKVNFSEKKTGYVQSAYDKSLGNLKDNSEKKSKELPKGEPVKTKDVAKSDKEDAVTEKTDQPDSPLKTVDDKKIERQEDHGVEKAKNMPKAQKMSKKTVDDDLTKSWKK